MAGQSVRASARRAIRRVKGRRSLESRIATLESNQIRVAELLDLVQELLLPVALQDRDKVMSLVERYTNDLDSSYRATEESNQ